MPWEKSYNETEVLKRAMTAFWARGYEATSMRDLVAATGINRGSIYAAFDDKHELFIEALRYYDKVHRRDFLDRMARRYAPKEAILAVFAAAAHGTGRGGRPAGCLLVNSALELSPHDPDVRKIVDASLRAVEDFFADRIAVAQADGSVRRSLDPRPTAQALLGLFLGVRVLARLKPRRDALDAIKGQARAMLE